jgi:hypothetical protein
MIFWEDDDGDVAISGGPLLRVPPACLVVRDYPAITVRGAVAVSWRRPPATHVPVVIFIVGVECQLVIVCAITFRKLRLRPRYPNGVEPWIQVLA